MGSYHKEVATFLLEGTEDANTTDQILIRVRRLSLCLCLARVFSAVVSNLSVQNLVAKIKELITRLQKLCSTDATGATYLTQESLQERKLPPHLQRFLYAVAVAEGLTRDGF